MICIKKGQGGGNPKPSVEFYSCRTEHTIKSAIQEGWALAHFVQNTVFSFDLKKNPQNKTRRKILKRGSWIPVYAGPFLPVAFITLP